MSKKSITPTPLPPLPTLLTSPTCAALPTITPHTFSSLCAPRIDLALMLRIAHLGELARAYLGSWRLRYWTSDSWLEMSELGVGVRRRCYCLGLSSSCEGRCVCDGGSMRLSTRGGGGAGRRSEDELTGSFNPSLPSPSLLPVPFPVPDPAPAPDPEPERRFDADANARHNRQRTPRPAPHTPPSRSPSSPSTLAHPPRTVPAEDIMPIRVAAYSTLGCGST